MIGNDASWLRAAQVAAISTWWKRAFAPSVNDGDSTPQPPMDLVERAIRGIVRVVRAAASNERRAVLHVDYDPQNALVEVAEEIAKFGRLAWPRKTWMYVEPGIVYASRGYAAPFDTIWWSPREYSYILGASVRLGYTESFGKVIGFARRPGYLHIRVYGSDQIDELPVWETTSLYNSPSWR